MSIDFIITIKKIANVHVSDSGMNPIIPPTDLYSRSFQILLYQVSTSTAHLLT